MVERPPGSGPLVASPTLRRRQLLALAAGTGVAVLAGCRASRGPGLWAVRGVLPPAWVQALPRPWQLRLFEDHAVLLAALQASPAEAPALVALTDGWASAEPRQHWQPLPSGQSEPGGTLARLAPFAAAASRLFAPVEPGPVRQQGLAGTISADSQVRAFPWAFSPWVIALRSRPDLAARAEHGWQLLLDPSLRGRLVLPSSPRVCIELMGGDFPRLRQLRRQALAFNDRDGLNLLLSGAAEAAVLPLRSLVPLLRRDPRLQVIWPASGSPLTWQLLLQPALGDQPHARQASATQTSASQIEIAASHTTVQDWPAAWLDAMFQPPLLSSLLAAGWVPPLPSTQLAPLVARFPAVLRPLLAPDPALLARCWSLPPLDSRGRLALQTLWDAAAPD